jgi:hypothetical protein
MSLPTWIPDDGCVKTLEENPCYTCISLGVPPTGHSADVDTVGNGATKDCAAADC